MSDPGGRTLTDKPSMAGYISTSIRALSQLAALPAGGSACLRRDAGNSVSLQYRTTFGRTADLFLVWHPPWKGHRSYDARTPRPAENIQ